MSEPVFTNNSPKPGASTEKRVEQVVKNPVKTRKNEVRKLADIFISEDVASVKNYIFMDVLVPAIKKAIYDIVTNGIDMFLYGGTGKTSSGSSGGKVSYRSYYDQKSGSSSSHRSSESTRRTTDAFDYQELVYRTRGDAEGVLSQLQDVIARYGVASINDLYDAIPDDMMPNVSVPFTSTNYGWMSLNGVKSVRVRDGYVLTLPKAMPLD
jgi:hypothetical protein